MPSSDYDVAYFSRRPPLRFWLLVVAGGLLSLGLKVPVMFRQHAAQDEDYYAAPGWSILFEGRPRVPYLPSRDPQSLFFGADVELYALPPLSFYWDAALYAVFGCSTGTARLGSGLAGVVSVLVVAGLARCLLKDEFGAACAALAYAFSRCVYFPWLMARPDALCALWGLAAVATLWTCQGTSSPRRAALAGGLAGLGLLTHPFALVPAIQCVAKLAWRRERGAAAVGVALFCLAALATTMLWLPLILQHPDLFRHQFLGNVLNQAGPGLPRRIVWPWPSIAVQSQIFLEHVGTWQAALMAGGWLATGLSARRDPRSRQLLWLATGAVGLHVILVGTHPTKSYWCYTGALLWLCVGNAVSAGLSQLRCQNAAWRTLRHRGRAIAAVACGIILLPGSGLRTLAVHVRHWDDPNYDARRFAARLMQEIPREAIVAVDPSYVFAFAVAGRPVLLALEYEPFFRISQHPFDVLVAGEYALRDGVPQAVQARLTARFGDPADFFACSAAVYEAPPERRAHAQ